MGNRHFKSYAEAIEEIEALLAKGQTRNDAVAVVSERRGLKVKALRDACNRYGVPADSRKGGPRSSRPLRVRSIVQEAAEFLDLAERAVGEITSLKGLVLAKDRQILNLTKRLESGTEVAELEALRGRFREVGQNLRKHLPAVGETGGQGIAS